MCVAKARNVAISKANGKYIAFLDSDDLWREEKLEKQISFMKEKQIAFSYTACAVISVTGQQTDKIRYVPEKADYYKLLKGNYIPCLTVILDKEQVVIPDFPKIHHEDYAVWLMILKKGIQAYGINEVLADYRLNNSSVSSNKLKSAMWTWDIYRKHQNMNFFKSSYYFINYLIKAVRKRL